jgi:hypothetical protein
VTVTPYTGPEDPVGPDGSIAGAGSGGNASIPANAQIPDLTVIWDKVPDIVPSASGSGSGSQKNDSPKPPVSKDFSVDLGGIRALEGVLLDASREMVAEFDLLKGLFLNRRDTVFGQQAVDVQMQENGSPAGDDTWSQVTSPDPIQQAAQQFADGTNGQPGMNDMQAYLLQQIGDAMSMVGQYIAVLSMAANAYAQADFNSVLPPVETTHD